MKWRFALILSLQIGVISASAEIPDTGGNALEPSSRSESARLALFNLHRRAGRLVEARTILTDLDRALPPTSIMRADLASAYELIELRADALAVWDAFEKSGGQPSRDQRMKMARLQESLGQKEAALREWRRVWHEQVPQSQRDIVEDRILALAAELGRMGELAVEIEIGQRGGRADQADKSLLVHLYARARQQLSAVESIDEFSREGADSIQSLKEQAAVYRRLEDGPAFERSVLELARRDPKRRAEYFRWLIVDQLDRDEPDKLVRIRRFLSELRSSDEAGAGAEFEAGVLVLAELYAEAVDGYRRATILNPLNPDNHLLMGDALKRMRRNEEGLAHFQHLALDAGTTPLFVAAVDGLLNVLANDRYKLTAVQVENRWRGIFKWTARAILERSISGRDEAFPYQVLSEVFDSGGDGMGSFTALESLLPVANGLRSSVLRELITRATPAEGADSGKGFGILKDSARRRLSYGRRLVALNDSMPPEVYVNLGGEFLASSDTASAARAFGLAMDAAEGSGLTNQIAKIYDDAGFDDLAVDRYRVALVADSGDVEMMVRLARLLDRSAQRERANELYAEAMNTLLKRQPSRVQNTALPTREYRSYYDFTIQGLLLTWPRDAGAAAARLLQFEKMFDLERAAEVGNVVERLALATGNVAMAESVKPAFASLSFPEALAEARRTNRFDRAASISLLDGDQSEMLAMARAWAKGGMVLEAVAWADHGRLEPRNFRDLCLYAAQLLKRPGNGLREADERGTMARIEEMTGEPLFTTDEIFAQVQAQIDVQPKEAAIYLSPESLEWINSHLDAEDRLRLLQRLHHNEHAALSVFAYWRTLLRSAMEKSYAEKAARIVVRAMERSDGAAQRAPLVIMATLIEPRMHPANIEVATAVVQRWMARSPYGIDFLKPVALLQSGRTDEVLDAYLEVLSDAGRLSAAGVPSAPDSLFPALEVLRSAFLPRYRQELEARLGRLEMERGISGEILELRFGTLDSQNKAGLVEEIAFLEKAVDLQPRNDLIIGRLQGLYQTMDDPLKATAMLERLHQIDPDEPTYRAWLYASYVNLDRPLDALELSRSSSDDLSNPGFFEAMAGTTRTSSARGLVPPPMSSLAADWYSRSIEVERMAAALASKNPQAMQRELRRMWQDAVPMNRDPTTNPSMDHTSVLMQQVPVAADASPIQGKEPVSALFEELRGAAGSDNRIVRALLEYPFMQDELEDYLRSLPPEEGSAIQGIQDLIAEAYERNGVRQEKCAALDEIVRTGQGTTRQFSLWLRLLAKGGRLDARGIAVMDQWRADDARLSLTELSLMARAYASSAQQRRAADTYRLIAIRSLTMMPELNSVFVTERPVSAVSLLEESARYLDLATQEALVRDVSRLIKPQSDASPAKAHAYQLFQLAIGTYDPLREPQSGAPSANVLLAMAERLLESGDIDGVMRALQSMLVDSGPVSESTDLELQRYSSMLGVPAPYEFDLALLRFGKGAPPAVLRRISGGLAGWEAGVGVNEDRRLLLLIAMSYRLGKAGDAAGAQQLLARISSKLLMPERFQRQTTDLAMEVARDLGSHLDLPTEQAILSHGRLGTAQVADVIERMAKEEGVTRAMELGEGAATFTQDDGLLQLLAKLAGESGNQARAEYWKAQRHAAAQARRALGMKGYEIEN